MEKLQFTIKGKTYTVKEPTIRDYYKIQHLFAKQEVNAKIEILADLSDCDIATLKLLDKYQFLELWNELIVGPLNMSDTTPFHKSFMIDEQLYAFLDMDKITLGEYSDMDVLRNDPKSQQNLHTMMAILYRPAIYITDQWLSVEEYNSDLLKQRSDIFMDLPLKYVTGALNFFLQVANYLFENTLVSLIKEEKMTELEMEMLEITNQIIKESLEIGRKSSTSAAETILPKLERLNQLALLASSTTWHTEKIKQPKKKSFVRKWNWLTNVKLWKRKVLA